MGPPCLHEHSVRDATSRPQITHPPLSLIHSYTRSWVCLAIENTRGNAQRWLELLPLTRNIQWMKSLPEQFLIGSLFKQYCRTRSWQPRHQKANLEQVTFEHFSQDFQLRATSKRPLTQSACHDVSWKKTSHAQFFTSFPSNSCRKTSLSLGHWVFQSTTYIPQLWLFSRLRFHIAVVGMPCNWPQQLFATNSSRPHPVLLPSSWRRVCIILVFQKKCTSCTPAGTRPS